MLTVQNGKVRVDDPKVDVKEVFRPIVSAALGWTYSCTLIRVIM
jgi:hypothetical protein